MKRTELTKLLSAALGESSGSTSYHLRIRARHGFIVEDRETDRRNLREFFQTVRESREQLRMTVLTTLQCNFACDYCIQGDHGEYNKNAAKMSLEMAARVSAWTEARMDEIQDELDATTRRIEELRTQEDGLLVRMNELDDRIAEIEEDNSELQDRVIAAIAQV